MTPVAVTLIVLILGIPALISVVSAVMWWRTRREAGK
jgi:hypothetical protein